LIVYKISQSSQARSTLFTFILVKIELEHEATVALSAPRRVPFLLALLDGPVRFCYIDLEKLGSIFNVNKSIRFIPFCWSRGSSTPQLICGAVQNFNGLLFTSYASSSFFSLFNVSSRFNPPYASHLSYKPSPREQRLCAVHKASFHVAVVGI
jgi:hypothetical protein